MHFSVKIMALSWGKLFQFLKKLWGSSYKPSIYIKLLVCLCVTFFQSHYRYQGKRIELLLEGEWRCWGFRVVGSQPSPSPILLFPSRLGYNGTISWYCSEVRNFNVLFGEQSEQALRRSQNFKGRYGPEILVLFFLRFPFRGIWYTIPLTTNCIIIWAVQNYLKLVFWYTLGKGLKKGGLSTKKKQKKTWDFA